MRIRTATLLELTLPLTSPFETSSHAKSQLTHIVLRVDGDDGTVGFGEVASEAAPFYGPETVTTCWHMLGEFLIPAVLDLEWDDPRAVSERIARFRGNRFAKAGLDMAAWDLSAKARAISLAAALGGTAPSVRSGISLGIDPRPEDTAAAALRVAAAGHARVKLKIRPGMSVAVVQAVSDALGDRAIQLAVDANGSFSASDLDELEQLDHFGLSLIEQPFAPDAWLLHRELHRRVATPICLDESIVTTSDVELALELEACDIVNIKVSRLGGLSAAVAVHNVCRASSIPVWCGGMHEFGIGRAANVALASLPGFTEPGDLSGSSERYARDIVTPPIVAENGLIAIPTGTGIGHDVDWPALAATANSTLQVGAA